ncbi:hypothetical protein Q7P35_011287 [Cladosporium inversicolor]
MNAPNTLPSLTLSFPVISHIFCTDYPWSVLAPNTATRPSSGANEHTRPAYLQRPSFTHDFSYATDPTDSEPLATHQAAIFSALRAAHCDELRPTITIAQPTKLLAKKVFVEKTRNHYVVTGQDGYVNSQSAHVLLVTPLHWTTTNGGLHISDLQKTNNRTQGASTALLQLSESTHTLAISNTPLSIQASNMDSRAPFYNSTRVEEAARVIKGYARVRAKVLKGHEIPKFCISPGTYVQVTIAAFWNNSGRPERNNTVSGTVPSQQVAKKDESVARGSGNGRKKQLATTKGNGSVVSGESVEQGPISAVSSDTRANGSSAVDADGGGEDEDAEGQSDGDATVEQISNNAMPTVNNGRLGHETFGYAPDHASLRRSSYDRIPYACTFGHDPTTMSGFHHPIQATPHGLGSQGAFGLPAQLYPMPAPLSFGSGFISSTPPGAGYQQHNVYPLHGLRILPSPAAGYTTDYAMTGHLSAGLSNSQGPQNDVRETHTRKRRKFEQ